MSGSYFDFHQQMMRRRKPAERTESPTSAPKSQGPEPITVSQLTNRIDRLIKGAIPETLHVRGQLSNFSEHRSSGHLYFTLKDANSCIDCVMFQSEAARLKFTPEDGMEMVASGKLGVYVQRGKYQLYVTALRPLGQGALELAFQQMRAKLEAAGLFAAERKKRIPDFPRNIVLITSPEAAACHDMLKVLRRFAWLRVMIYPVAVQGNQAAPQIAAALAHVSARGSQIGAEVILLARGGGSLEDLWAFNEEVVARAIAASTIPVISGIGHEVDTTIADLVADHHAHTPTEGAQVVTANWRTAIEDIDRIHNRLRQGLRSHLQHARQRLLALERHEIFRRPLGQIQGYRQLLDDRQKALTMAMGDRINSASRKLHDLSAGLERRLPAVVRSRREKVIVLQQMLITRIGKRLRVAREEIARIGALLSECHPRYRVKMARADLQTRSDRLARALQTRLQQSIAGIEALHRQLEALSPQGVLKRGYTLTRRKKTGEILRGASGIKPGERILTQFADSQIESI
ncbi:MAG TPA: exodeoxyribonuclease VII large subunit, partial [Humisphaera sp.]|nr:exodeoxyribonuclease VII large subunit [Humisphaera sp.]